MKVIESMTRFQVYPYIVRVWRAETEARNEYDNEDLQFAANDCKWRASIVEGVPGRITPTVMAEMLSKMSRVNAVEVVHKDTGAGVIIYTDWP